MKITSIVVTYNALRNDWLYKCLGSLLQSEIETEIVVIDNNSTDETCEEIRNKYPTVILIENKENKGFGAANNQGFNLGIKNNSDYFFLLNQDAWIENDSLSKLISTASASQNFAIVSPLHYNGKGDSLDINFNNNIKRNCSRLYNSVSSGNFENDAYTLKFVNAAAWLLPRKTLQIIGGFSPAFFHYGEDANYCQRVLYHNLQIAVCPYSKIYHDRENRKSKINKEINFQNVMTLKYTNPAVKINLNIQNILLNFKIFKNIIQRRKDVANIYLDELNYLKNNTKEIASFNKKYWEVEEFKFLKI